MSKYTTTDFGKKVLKVQVKNEKCKNRVLENGSGKL